MLDKTSSIICAFGLASAAPRSPYRRLELCGIALKQSNPTPWNSHCARRHLALPQIPSRPIGQGLGTVKTVPYRTNYNGQHTLKQSVGRVIPPRRKLGQHRTIPALRLKHRSGSCGTASALPKCSIMSGCGTRIVLRGQKPLALCDRCPCFGSLFPPLAALTFAASSIICAFGLAAAAPRSPYRHLELCGIALEIVHD